MNGKTSFVSNDKMNITLEIVIIFLIAREKKKFRVYILVPLLPAFEGQVEDSSTGNALRVILHYNYASMCRGPNSLFSRLTENGINPMDYISFSSLRFVPIRSFESFLLYMKVIFLNHV